MPLAAGAAAERSSSCRATAAPPPPAPKVEVQATAGNVVVAPITSARTLYYETPVVSQSFAPSQAKEQDAAAPAPPTAAAARLADPADGEGQAVGRGEGSTGTSCAQPRRPVPVLRQADTITVELTPNDSGFLSVKRRPDADLSPVARLSTYTTEPLSPSDRELTVVFSRTAPLAVSGSVMLAGRNALQSNVLHRSEDADGTYVVGEPASPEIHFTITLSPQ